jgi:TRAP-type C4-dicarboxylate transport system permease small subunit
MNTGKIIAFVLVLAGVLALMYGGFSYTRGTHTAELGSLSMSFKDQETVNVPVWAGVGAIVIGGVLLIFQSKKS